MFSLAVVTFGIWAFAILFALVCLFMILVILIQKPKGGGLSSAFGGGGGGSQAVFGAKVGDALTWFTVVLFLLFLSIAIGLTWMTEPPDLTAMPSVDANPELPEGAEGPEEPTDEPVMGESEADDAASPQTSASPDAASPSEDAAEATTDPAAEPTAPPAEDAN